jgi:hypothetical protein
MFTVAGVQSVENVVFIERYSVLSRSPQHINDTI